MTKIVIVGEAWGQREKLFEHAFVGSSGVELAKMLAETNLAPAITVKYPSELDMISHWSKLRKDHGIEITNVFPFHPNDNNIDLCFTTAKEGEPSVPPLRPGKYLRPDLYHHLRSLWQFLREAQPNLIIAMGNTACWATLGESKITTLRGTIKASPSVGCKVLPTYHPAAVLRQWNLRPIVLADLEKARSEAEYSEVKRIERWVTIDPTLEEISAWFNEPADFYAVDIETAFKQISMIGFARSPNYALTIPFIDERKPGWSFWASPEEEIAAWKLADLGLKKNVPKIFQNGIYDLSYILRAGLRPTRCEDDTMLLHHSLYPEMLKSLGFLGSVYSSEIAWKTMRTKGNNLKRDE